MEGEDDVIFLARVRFRPIRYHKHTTNPSDGVDRLAEANGFELPSLLLDRIRLDRDKPNTDSDKLTPYRAGLPRSSRSM